MSGQFYRSIQDNGRILFHRKGKEIWWSYADEVRVPSKHHSAAYRIYDKKGRVPDEIVDLGEDAVREYAQDQVKRWLRAVREEEARTAAYLKNPDVPVEAEVDGVALKGLIISAEDTTLTVRLEKPFIGQASYVYSFAAAMQGKHMFDGIGKFSAHALEKAKSLLKSIYVNQKDLQDNAEWVEMVKRLNEK